MGAKVTNGWTLGGYELTDILCAGTSQRRIVLLLAILSLLLWTSFGAEALANGWIPVTQVEMSIARQVSAPAATTALASAATAQPAPIVTAALPVAPASVLASSGAPKSAAPVETRSQPVAAVTTAPAPTPAQPVSVASAASRSADMTITSVTTFSNVGTGAVSAGTATISLRAIPQSRDLIILSEVISPTPTQVTQDAAGNRVAKFDLSGLTVGQTLVVRQEYRVRIWSHSGDGHDGEVLGAHLQAQAKIEADAPAIRELAQRLVAGQSTTEGKLAAIFAGVRSSLKYSLSSPARNKGALAALTVGSGVCEEYASLFVALARASGIPSRVVVGYGRGSSSYQQAWSQTANNLSQYKHAWAEAYVPGYGWATFDPTLNRSSLAGVGGGQIPVGTLIAESYKNQSMSTAYSGGRLQTSWQHTVTW
jgi:transglutaminase-like putative cysteine protease